MRLRVRKNGTTYYGSMSTDENSLVPRGAVCLQCWFGRKPNPVTLTPCGRTSLTPVTSTAPGLSRQTVPSMPIDQLSPLCVLTTPTRMWLGVPGNTNAGPAAPQNATKHVASPTSHTHNGSRLDSLSVMPGTSAVRWLQFGRMMPWATSVLYTAKARSLMWSTVGWLLRPARRSHRDLGR